MVTKIIGVLFRTFQLYQSCVCVPPVTHFLFLFFQNLSMRTWIFVDIFQDNVEISELILRDGTRNCNCCQCHLLLSDDMSHDMDTDTVWVTSIQYTQYCFQ